jgi:hypothetical protein
MPPHHPLFVRTASLLVSLVLSALTVTAQTSEVRARIAQPVDVSALVPLRGNVHPLARAAYDRGVAPDDLPMARMLLVLQRGEEEEAGLRKLLEDQQVKSSANYHQWLTPEQFGQRFGPAEADVQAVADWLTGQGFEVNRVAVGRAVIEFSGTVGLVRQGLHTEIHRFVVNGEEHWANASDPQIPAALAPEVAGVASLNNFPRKPQSRRLGTFRRSKLTGEVRPLFSIPQPNPSYYLVGPADFATIYHIPSSLTGAGQTIAVVGQTDINIQDVRDFRSMFGLPANDPNIIVDGPDPGITGDEGESDLDVEWSGAAATGATIDLVVSETTSATAGIDLSALYIIDNNLAPVMSESYGGCEADLGASGNAFYSTLWEQAAAQGITVVVASGDSGSAGCDGPPEMVAQYGLAVSGFASTPFNVAVGGTDFNDVNNWSFYWNTTNAPLSQASAKSYIPESTWNNSCAQSGLTGCADASLSQGYAQGIDLAAGSGGPSNCTNPSGSPPSISCTGGYAKPAWQSGAGVPQDGARDIPDISLFSGDGLNNSYYVVCQTDANASSGGSSSSCDLNSPYEDFQGAGGTSASAQTFAGIMALVNQAHGRQGNANYVLYPLAAKTGASCDSSTVQPTSTACIFHDITQGNNSVACQAGTPNCSNTSNSGFGIMVINPASNPQTLAWTTNPGYDLATGLGSVNVANLVNHWNSVSFTPSTTTLSLSTNPSTNPITLTHGQSVNVDVTVAPQSGSGTPTGDAALIAQTGNSNSTAVGSFALSAGSVSSTTNMLPGGSYNVIAHYAGNGTYGASDSNPVPVTVGKENSQTTTSLVTFDANGNPTYGATTTPYGSSYMLRVDVMNSRGQKCATSTGLISFSCPTGTVTVAPPPPDEAPPPNTIPGSYALNSQGFAEDRYAQLPTQTWNFTATYPGDKSYNQSSSKNTITITQAPTTISVGGIMPGTNLTVGSSFTCQVGVYSDSNGVPPSGTIQMLGNGTPMGPPWSVTGIPYNPTGGYVEAQVTVNATLPAGIWNVTFQYSGDNNYAGSTSPSGETSIAVGDFTLSANPSPVIISAPGQTGNTTVNVTSQYNFVGTVNLSITSGCPMGATCTLSSPSVTFPTNNVTVTDALTITTMAASSAPPALQRRVLPSFRLPVRFLWLLAGSLALAMLLSSSPIRRRPAALLFATTLLVAVVWAACGGGEANAPPPPPLPAVSLSPKSLTFSSQHVGTSSAAQGVTLSDTGNGALNVMSIGFTGPNAGDFSQTNTCGSTVAAGNNCAISVMFAPTAAGARSASLYITDNTNNSPQTVSLTGTAVMPPTPAGSYIVVVTGTSGSDSHTMPLTVTVQ